MKIIITNIHQMFAAMPTIYTLQYSLVAILFGGLALALWGFLASVQKHRHSQTFSKVFVELLALYQYQYLTVYTERYHKCIEYSNCISTTPPQSMAFSRQRP
jgi:hypothetical protein